MKKTLKTAVGILGLLVIVGLATWVYQLTKGLGITGMSNGTSWGLYICLFMLFVGLSAGGLIVASSASVFKVKKYKKVALPAVVLSTACIVVAALFVLVDLGGIQRMWQLLVSPHLSSPLLWDVVVIILYLLVNVLYLVNMTSASPQAERRVEIISRFALPLAVLVHTVTAWIFGLQYARAWYSSIMGPLFVASALDSGLGLLLLVLLGLRKTNGFPVSRCLVTSLAGLMAVCIAVDAYLLVCELLTAAYPLDTSASPALGEMIFGATAPYFWCEVIGGLVIPFGILVFAKNRKKLGLVALSSVLVVMGVCCKRIWLLFTSFIHPNIAYGPGIIEGSFTARESGGDQVWASSSNYIVQLPEFLIALGVISLGALIFIGLFSQLIPRYRQTHSSYIHQLEDEVNQEAVSESL